MPNIHTPERGARESQADYRARRAASRAIVKTMRKGPTQAPVINALGVSLFWIGQHTNPERAARRAVVRALGRRQAVKAFKTQAHQF